MKKEKDKRENNQAASQQNTGNSEIMARSDTSIPSGEPLSSSADLCSSAEQRKQERLQKRARREAGIKKAFKLAEVIIEGKQDFNIEHYSWKILINDSSEIWSGILRALEPEVRQEERETFNAYLERDSKAFAIMKSEEAAIFLLGVALGQKKSQSSVKSNTKPQQSGQKPGR